jgi:hypothetical protein
MPGKWFAVVSWLITVSAVSAGEPAFGQEPLRVGNPLVPHVSASAALDLRNGQSRYPAMYLGFANLEWSTHVPGLGIRVEGVYARRGQENRVYAVACGSDCYNPPGSIPSVVYWSQTSAAGGFVGAAYDVLHGGAFRPHVMASVGAAQTHDRSIRGLTGGCPTCAVSAGNTTPLLRTNERTVSGAAEIGAGAAYSWRWISVVAEARYVAIANGSARGMNGAFPLSLGFRF